ncbi:MAG: hypothetical protein P1T08_06575 [Acidimicrobiia bacterium]|nr:hypothetical protein [Acidimicrobiia bacterium]
MESVSAAQIVLNAADRDIVDEPIQAANTNRHGFLHGNVAGIIRIHHAVKVFTLVDALVDMAEEYASDLPDERRLERAPWEDSPGSIIRTPVRYGPLPGMSALNDE